MDKIAPRELVLMRRAAEDACSAMNRRYEPFIEAVAKPLTIIALLDLVQSRQTEVDEYKTWVEQLQRERNFLQKRCAERADTIDDLQKRLDIAGRKLQLVHECIAENAYSNMRSGGLVIKVSELEQALTPQKGGTSQ